MAVLSSSGTRASSVSMLVAGAVLATCVGTAGPARAQESVPVQLDRTVAAATASLGALAEASQQELVQALSLIERMPVRVVHAGPVAMERWLHSQGVSTSLEARSTVGCVIAIGAVILTLGPLKILKLKSLFNALGGVTKFVGIFLRWYKAARAGGSSVRSAVVYAANKAAAGAGTATRDALLELFGIGAVIDQCLS